jgi:hypothetical protein
MRRVRRKMQAYFPFCYADLHVLAYNRTFRKNNLANNRRSVEEDFQGLSKNASNIAHVLMLTLLSGYRSAEENLIYLMNMFRESHSCFLQRRSITQKSSIDETIKI